MSDPTASTEPEATEANKATPAQVAAAKADAEKARTEGDDLAAWKAEARKWEAQAKANADAAKRLAEIEESQKSEAEKAADRIRQLEAETEAARREALRFKVATKHGIGDEDADLFLTGSDEETLTKQAERLAARMDGQMKNGNHVPREGSTPTAKQSVAEKFAAAFESRT